MNRTLLTSTIIAGVAAPFLAAGAAPAPNVVDLSTWDRTNAQNGWSAEELLDWDVYGPTGDEIGEVEDILVGPDGRIQAIIVETESFLDIGDVHARVEWSKVSAGPEEESVRIPLTEDTLENYRMNYDDISTGNRSWRVRELIGDSVMLQDRQGYGTVDDVIFDRQNQLVAVVVDADYGYGYGVGPYAYPYYGYDAGWDPGLGYYEMPYDRNTVADYEPFEYEQRGPLFE